MEHYLILAHSVTHAQRLERLLQMNGIPGRSYHAPMELTGGQGCSYAIQVDKNDLAAAMQVIRGAGLRPASVYWSDGATFREVRV